MICPKCGEPIFIYKKLDAKRHPVVQKECGCGVRIVKTKKLDIKKG